MTSPGQQKTWGGMRMFVGNRVAADDPRLASVYDNFRANLSDICRVARGAGAKVIVSTVVTNLKDCPPFASVHRAGLSDAEKARWDKLYAEGTGLAGSGDHEQAVGRYLAAAKIDDRFAELHFRLAHSLMALEHFARAREHFVLARDLDALRFRADTRINDIIRQVAGGRQAEGVYLVDAERTVAKDQMPGFELLYEHVHLTFEGKYAVAAAIFERAAQVLPKDLRGPVAGDPAPPSLQRCAELVMFTLADRAVDAMEIAKVLKGPPFSAEQHARVMDLHLRLRKQLPPDRLAPIAERYRKVLAARPDDLGIRSNFAYLQRVRRDYPSAGRQYQRLLDRYPHYPRWRYFLAEALENRGKLPEAIEQYRLALSVCPGEVFALSSLAKALDKNGQVGQAIEYYRRALELNPDAVQETVNLALIYATSPDDALRDGAEAVRLAEHACQVGGRGPVLLDVLACAYAENGQFKEAMGAAREAHAMAQAEGKTDLARKIAARLKLYEAGRAFRGTRARQ